MTTPTLMQPEISYQPNLESHLSRVERLKPERPLDPSLPAGFPKQLTGGLVWEGAEFKDEKQWTMTFSESQLREIDAGLRYFQGTMFL